MTTQLSRERLEEKLLEHIKHGGDSEEETMIRMLLAGMDSEPVAWIAEAKKLAEMYGISFVVFRNGKEPQCADPTKVVISFADKGLGYPAAPEQEV